MAKEDRLIVHYSRDNKVIAVYNSADEASLATGIQKGFIIRNLKGLMNDCPDRTKFRYEVKASDLRKLNREKKKEKEDEMIRRFFGDDR